MYCRGCRYDLRHLPEMRCPECGLPFDRLDRSTYLHAVPTLSLTARRLFALVSPGRRDVQWLLFGTLTLIVALLPVLFPRAISCGGKNPLLHNPRHIAQALTAYPPQPGTAPFSPDSAALTALPPGFSNWTQQDVIRKRQRWENYAKLPLVDPALLAAWFGLLAVAGPRAARRRCAICTILLLPLVTPFVFPSQAADWVWPPSHRYLDDYAFAADVDWGLADPVRRGQTIIAYEKQSWSGWRRCVGYLDGRAEMLRESEFLALAAEQGLEPNPP